MDARTFLPPKPPRRQPVRWHIGTDAVVSILGVDCKCIENSELGYVFAHVKNPESTFPMSVAEFDDLKDLETFRYEKDGLTAETSHALLHSGVRSLSDLPKEQRDYINWKARICRTFLEMHREGRATKGDVGLPDALNTIRKKLDKEIHDAQKRGGRRRLPKTYPFVGARQFRIWLKRFQKDGVLGLCERYHNCGKNGPPYYNEDEWEVLFEYVWKYLTTERLTVVELYRQMEAAITGTDGINAQRRRNGQPDLRVPTDDMLGREIARLPKFDVMAARYSEAEAINFFRAAQGGVTGLVKPMQRVEADEWKTHLHTLAIELKLWEPLTPELKETINDKKVRVCLAVALCCTTRCIVGMTVAPEAGSQSSRELLRMSLMDKTQYARFVGAETPWEYRALTGTWAVDEGSSNLNMDTEMLCADLGIGFKAPQAEMPTQRGKIERFFRTLDIRALIRFSGRTFSNPAKRKKYDSLARACVTVDEFCALIVRFIVDEYHNTKHAGLNGEMPRAAWLRISKQQPPTVPPGPAKIRSVFGEDMTATLQPSGLRVFGNWYWSRTLHEFFEQVGKIEVDIRVDTEDLGAISVRRPGGWLSVPGPDFTKGLPLAVWESANESMRRENNGMEDMAKPVALRAIAYQMKGHEETRKRLLIQYRPMTGEDFARARRRMWIGVRDKRDPDPAPQPAQMDLFARSLPTGRSAQRKTAPRKAVVRGALPAKPAEPAAKTKPVRRAQTKQQPAPSVAKPARKWTIRRR